MNGIILVDKEVDYTSRDVDNILMRTFKTRSVGHLGTLDPFATGLLICGINQGTKIFPLLEDFDKTYEAELKLGIKTDSGDLEGQVILTQAVKQYTEAEILAALNSLLGTISQLPPMHSALKVNGVPLYKLAHQGIEIERVKREITIHELKLISYHDDIINFQIRCSKGTYVRTFGEDLALKLQTIGHLISLRRVAVGPFNVSEGIKVKEADEGNILSSVEALSFLPILTCGEFQSFEDRLRMSEYKVALIKTMDSKTIVLAQYKGQSISLRRCL